jgi:hypothetical protein
MRGIEFFCGGDAVGIAAAQTTRPRSAQPIGVSLKTSRKAGSAPRAQWKGYYLNSPHTPTATLGNAHAATRAIGRSVMTVDFEKFGCIAGAKSTRRFIVVNTFINDTSVRRIRMHRHAPSISQNSPRGAFLHEHERPSPLLFEMFAARSSRPRSR